MNILITGTTGFVGRHLYKKLAEKHDLFILVRPSTDYKEVCAEHIYIFEDDIEHLAWYLRENHIDGIIHLASLCLVTHQSSQIKDLVLSNIYLGTVLLEAAKSAGVAWFLNTGSIWQNYLAADETDEYNPVNLYAATKQAFLTMAKYYTETSPMRFCTLKLCDTYGPGDTRGKVLSLLKGIAQSGKTLDMSCGEQKLDLLYIDDVVEGFICLMNSLNEGTKSLRPEYVLTSGKTMTLRELATIYEKVCGVNLSINWGGRPYREREVMNPYRGHKLEGWTPKISIEEGLALFNKSGGGGNFNLIVNNSQSLERRAA